MADSIRTSTSRSFIWSWAPRNSGGMSSGRITAKPETWRSTVPRTITP